MNRARIAIGALVLSAAGFIGIVSDEGFTERAVVPVPGDRFTVGFGSTFWENGAPVKNTDKVAPVRALHLAHAHLTKEESRMRACIGAVPLHQHEYDAIISWSYNVGSGAACGSTLVKKLKARDYTGACNELMRWRLVAGREVRGLTLRRERERNQCLGVPQ